MICIDESRIFLYNVPIIKKTAKSIPCEKRKRKVIEMTYHELVEKVAKALTAVDASAVSEHIAVQVNVTGEGEGAFYIEAADGKLAVEPYDYIDRDAMLTASAEDLLAVAAGKLNLEAAIAEGKMALEGNYDKLMQLNSVFAQLPVKKRRAPAKKKTEDAAEKTAAKKVGRPRKTAAKAAPAETVAEVKAEAAPEAAETPAKTAKKPAAKKTAEKKPAAKKTTRKTTKADK